MSNKTYQVVDGELSDGYHTFDELYDHRHALFLAWINTRGHPGDCYVVEDHFAGWDIVVCEWMINPTTNPAPYQRQISYHIPIQLRRYYAHLPRKTMDEHNWDGHTPKQVVQRIYEWLNLLLHDKETQPKEE